MKEYMRPKDYLKQGLIELGEYVTENIGEYQDVHGVEIGSYAGESAKILLGFVDSLICVDTWEDFSSVRSRDDAPAEIEAAFDKRVGSSPRVTKLKMKSEDAAAYVNSFVNVVYIDGDHSYESVKRDIELWLPHITRPGFIAGHDYNSKWHYGVTEAVHEVLGEPDAVFSDSSWVKAL